jgi:hypothetical protein
MLARDELRQIYINKGKQMKPIIFSVVLLFSNVSVFAATFCQTDAGRFTFSSATHVGRSTIFESPRLVLGDSEVYFYVNSYRLSNYAERICKILGHASGTIGQYISGGFIQGERMVVLSADGRVEISSNAGDFGGARLISVSCDD